jgi:hypothetical protein
MAPAALCLLQLRVTVTQPPKLCVDSLPSAVLPVLQGSTLGVNLSVSNCGGGTLHRESAIASVVPKGFTSGVLPQAHCKQLDDGVGITIDAGANGTTPPPVGFYAANLSIGKQIYPYVLTFRVITPSQPSTLVVSSTVTAVPDPTVSPVPDPTVSPTPVPPSTPTPP